jgi:hypothetical protein
MDTLENLTQTIDKALGLSLPTPEHVSGAFLHVTHWIIFKILQFPTYQSAVRTSTQMFGSSLYLAMVSHSEFEMP